MAGRASAAIELVSAPSVVTKGMLIAAMLISTPASMTMREAWNASLVGPVRADRFVIRSTQFPSGAGREPSAPTANLGDGADGGDPSPTPPAEYI